MARSSSTIRNQILSEVANQPALGKLNSTSKASIWRLFVDVVTSALTVSEQLWDVFQVNLERIAAEAVAGTASWLQRQVLNFQFGDHIEVNSNYTVSYPMVDASKRIVTRCSVKQLEDSREVLVKVAKGTTNTLEPLAQDELNALKSYITKVQFAGTYITAISLEADRLNSNINIYFDAEYVQSVVKAGVIDAINNFLKNLEFDGKLYKTKFQDAIQLVPGVVDVEIVSLVARPFLTPISDPSVVPFSRTYDTDAGYIVPEDTAGYSLDDTINMIPN